MKMTCQKSMMKPFLMKKPWLGAVKAVEEFKLLSMETMMMRKVPLAMEKQMMPPKKINKPFAENAAKESANYNWPDLTDNGHDTGVSPLYRAVKGLKLLGTKSASIVP
ncbi:hypothetical protein Peur_015949 [Populus x canadensis]